jgi:hypothetical protein
LAYVGIRLHLRGVLHKQGHGIIAVNKMIAGADDSTIDAIAQSVPTATDSAYSLLVKIGTGQVVPGPVKATAAGGFFSTLIADVVAFFGTPQGQALEGALITALIALISGA